MHDILDAGELEEDSYKFLYYLLSRKELNQKDISIICLSLFGDGLSTVGNSFMLLFCYLEWSLSILVHIIYVKCLSIGL